MIDCNHKVCIFISELTDSMKLSLLFIRFCRFSLLLNDPFSRLFRCFTLSPEFINLLLRSTQLSLKIQMLIKPKILTNKSKFLALSFSGGLFIMLINVEMPTTVGILTFKSWVKFVIS